MKQLLTCLIFTSMFLFMACQQEELNSPAIDKKENTADFLINNNSTHDISITYVTSSKLGFKESEGFITISKQSSKKIFDVSFVSEFPYPSTALYSLSFYLSSSAGHSIITQNKPVVDEAWVVIDQALDSEGFGHTSYQLSYSDVKAD
ncbi:hypothetical protein [Reichenbachiella sp.]|uniref:hypothetical protein n=1 Tax=Reichenbachiella sp. TaxID=2184521 RepID=UPI003B58C260